MEQVNRQREQRIAEQNRQANQNKELEKSNNAFDSSQKNNTDSKPRTREDRKESKCSIK